MARPSRPASEGLRRAFVTPEGVDLRLELGTMGERAGAFLLDLVFILVALIAMTILAVILLSGAGQARMEAVAAIWLLGFFLLRNGYFTAFELGPRAATPGKRLLKLRVVARDGTRLSGPAVIGRNAMRELELFLPLTFLLYLTAEGMANLAIAIAGLAWTGVFLFFPAFNRDRLRVGDLIAGTWVTRLPRHSLAASVAEIDPAPRYVFTDAQLAAYGEFELQKLEEVLRRRDDLALIVVARTIRARIGWPEAEGDDEAFLQAYYAALCGRLERNMLFGKRRADKYA
jgi:uncharacterized RDD family membrane protein YckC